MEESRFSARRWTAQQQSSAGLTADEEAWDVTFRSPRSAPLEIRASRKTKLIGPTPVCLASLPDAARQEATLIVRSLGPQIVQIKTHRLKPLPTEAAPAGQVQTARASYQYDPRTEATPQSEPAIVLTAAGSESAAAWVWDCEVRSQLAANGAADHVVSYRIQNAGSRQIRLTLPAGRPAPRRPRDLGERQTGHGARSGADPAAGELAVDLPADLKFVTLDLRFSTRGEPLGTFTSPATAAAGDWTAGIRAALAVGTAAGLCRVQRFGQDPQAAEGGPSASAAACWAAWGEAKTNRSSTLCVARTGNRCCVGEGTETAPPTLAPTCGNGRMDAIPDRPGRWHIDRDRGPPRRDRRRGWMLFLAIGRHRGLGPFRPSFHVAAAGGRAGSSRPAAACGDLGHSFPTACWASCSA